MRHEKSLFYFKMTVMNILKMSANIYIGLISEIKRFSKYPSPPQGPIGLMIG
jgi:hypothetical protein